MIDVIVREYSPGVWAWKRKDKRKYKREEARRKILRDDLYATRCRDTVHGGIGAFGGGLKIVG